MSSATVRMRRPCSRQKGMRSGMRAMAAVVAHDFADDAGGGEAGEAGQVNGGLGLAGADEDPAAACAEREDVARTDEVG